MENEMNEFIDAPGSINLIKGAGGGKGGGGRQAQEAENTLRSSAVVRVVEVVSEGPIEGIAGGGAGIYINDTPLFNQDGTTNFPRVQWDYRVGLPSQDYMAGFNSVEAEVSVNTAVTIATNNIIRTVSSVSIDAVNVTIQLPQGLSEQNTSNGDINGSSVTFSIDTRLGSGAWSTYGTYTITGKTMNPYEAQYRIQRPAGTGLWSVRVTRITADPAANVRNYTTWSRMTEIQEIQVTYPDAAVVGIAIDAETVGNQIPKRAYLVKGVLVDVPSNYNTATNTYSGAWNGLFTTATVAVDNPVWVLYDIMTNERYGAGINPSEIDKYSFYDAAVYCDQLVSVTPEGSSTTTERRYTFNARIADRPEMVKLIKAVCGAMHANLIFWNGKWTLIQDRPTSVSKLITKANVIDGQFTYKSSSLFERHTAVNVSFNDRADRHLERVVTVEDEAAIAMYGYNTIDLAAFGCTTEGQAIRAGRWVLDSEQNQSDIVEFKMLLNGMDIMPGDVVSVYDEDYANNTGGGKIVSYTAGSTTVVLDRPCDITPGSTISALLADGRTIETKSITGTGTISTVTIASAFSTALHPQADFIITSTISPRPFRIIDITVPEPGVVNVKGAFYDANKFARVETGVVIPNPTFSNQVRTVVPPPTGLTLTVEGHILPATGLPRRYVRADWTPPTGIAGYNVTWDRNNGNRQSLQVDAPTCLIPADEDGTYTVNVFSRDFNGAVSAAPVSSSLVVTSSVLTVDPTGFGAPINLVCVDSNSTTWVQNDMVFRWADNSTNTRPAASYKIEIYTTSDTLLRTVDNYPSRQYNYTLADNTADGSGTPRTSLKVKVYARDAQGAFSTPNTQTFTNPPPAAVTGASASGMYKAAALKWSPNTEADLQGYYVWRGNSSGFSPSTSNLVYNGPSASFLDGPLNDNTTYYWKIAAFDRFSNSTSGAGLNIVTVSTTSGLEPGIPGLPVAPSGAAAGDFYYNTSDKNLYKYDGSNWRVVGTFQGTTAQMNAKTGMFTGDLWSNTTDGKLYRYNGSTWTAAVPAVDITGNLSNSQIADLAAAKLTGQITTTQITDSAISAPKIAAGAVITGKLATDSVVASNIQAGAVTAGKIAAGAITANEIAANTITAAKIASGTITANEIAGSSITAGKLAANSVSTSNIQAGAITAASGIIGDAAVTTLKIAGNAVTIPLGTYAPGGPFFMQSTTQNVQALTITVATACKIIITMSGMMKGAAVVSFAGGEDQIAVYTYYPMTVGLNRNGSIIYTCDQVGDGAGGSPFSATVVDTVSAGTHTYTWYVQSAYIGEGYSWYANTRAFYKNPAMTVIAAQR